jgi:hypothetical protein
LDIQVGNVNIYSVLPSTSVYSTAGSYTISVPFGVTSVNYEMIGAGGATSGGTGGYIRGSITLTSVMSTIKVVVGAVGSAGLGGSSSGASYINVPTAGPLFVMAGAGGAGSGGYGGGGTFNGAGVAFGGPAGFLVFTGGSSQTDTGGGLGYDCSINPEPSGNGGNAGSSGAFEQALGGTNAGRYAGGSGYAGGGAACAGGGGGSSYYNTSTTTVTLSYDGSTVPGGVLSGYGRSGQGGYVSISLVGNANSVTANGDVQCRNLFTSTTTISTLTASTMTVSSLLTTSSMNTSTIQMTSLLSSATGRILLGTGTPVYRLEINGGGVNNTFTTGWRYGNGGGAANPGGGITDPISLKTQNGIWASIFYATSDQRIKKEITEIDDDRALQVVRRIKPVTFKYIDQVNRHGETEYGFIAQDIKQVLPHAVKTEADFIPNVYDLADFSTLTQSTSLVTLRTKQVEGIKVNDRIKIIDLREKACIQTILETGISSMVVDANLENYVSEYDFTEEDIKNNIQKNTIFVYGKQVDDVNVLDKNAIFSVGIAAMQEIDRLIVQQHSTITQQINKIQELQEKCKTLQNQIMNEL